MNVKWCFCRFLKRFKIGISYYSAFLRVLIISIGAILEVIFKVLSCRDIAGSNLTVHFYYGDTQCYGSGWFVALFGLLALLQIWLFLDFVLWRQGEHVRQSEEENPLVNVVNSYHPRYVDMLSFTTMLTLCTCNMLTFSYLLDSSY